MDLMDTRSDLNANVAADYELSKRLLAEYGLRPGDTILVEARSRTETRRYLGSVLFCWPTRTGSLHVTYSGKSGWAPGAGSALLVGPAENFGATVIRKLRPSDKATMHGGSHWSTSRPHPLNERIEIA